MSSIAELQKQQINVLFGKLIHTTSVLRLAHWKTTSFAKHEALGSLYDDISELTDKLVESYQGEFGIQNIKIPAAEYTEPISHLEAVLSLLKASQPLFKDSDYLNIIDELKTAVKVTLYKLKNLS